MNTTDTTAEIHSVSIDTRIAEHLATLDRKHAIARLLQRDGNLFSDNVDVAKSVRNRLGWLFYVQAMKDEVERLVILARVVERQGYKQVLVIGMGGSSLFPEVVATHLQGRRGLPIRIVDTTHPEAIGSVIAWSRAQKTLFIVATKSGGTVEPISIYRTLRAIFPSGADFVAVTDPGSGLQTMAQEEGFRDIFLNPADIGGRFSAGSLFGLVPAALAGVVLHDAIARIEDMLVACTEDPAALNPGAQLGAFLAASHNMGRWQLRLSLGKDVRAFGGWIEQLIAESTGKHATGLLPVLGGVLGSGAELGAKLQHACVVSLTTFAHPDDEFVARAQEAGVPTQAFVMPEVDDLWTEIVRWEMATALCGLLLDINPFDEPDVTSAKTATNGLLSGTLAPVEPDRRVRIERFVEMPAALAPELAQLRADDYLAVLCYVQPTTQNLQRLESLRQALQAKTDAAVTVQIGPRYLHSTGQYHKGGMARGLFVVADDFGRFGVDVPDIAIPQASFSFAQLVTAQALGDVAVLKTRGKPVIAVELAVASAKA